MKALVFIYLFCVLFNYCVTIFYYTKIKRKVADFPFKLAVLITAVVLSFILFIGISFEFISVFFTSVKKKTRFIDELKTFENA